MKLLESLKIKLTLVIDLTPLAMYYTLSTGTHPWHAINPWILY